MLISSGMYAFEYQFTEFKLHSPALSSLIILHCRVSFSDPLFLGGAQQEPTSVEEQLFIGNLHPGATYSFTVIAFNEIGLSSESEPLLVIMLEEGTEN